MREVEGDQRKSQLFSKRSHKCINVLYFILLQRCILGISPVWSIGDSLVVSAVYPEIPEDVLH